MNPLRRHGLIVFSITAVSGPLSGQTVETGISEDEARAWPITPPHWVHLPAEVQLARTNAQASPHPGWLMHSRNIEGWANDSKHAVAWMAHVRSVLAGAL